mgnify:CR=1 FL=1
MRGLSVDLRERIVKRYESGKDAAEVAGHFEVSERSVYRYVGLARAGKSLEPNVPPGRQSVLEREDLAQTLQRLVKEDSEAPLAVYVARLKAQTGIVISTPSMCRALKKLDLTRKKRPNSLKSVTRRPD